MYETNTFTWNMRRCVYGDVLRQAIFRSGVFLYALWQRVERRGPLGSPTQRRRGKHHVFMFIVSVA